jgi:hypothetical protein
MSLGKIEHYLGEKIFGRRFGQVYYAPNDFGYALRVTGNIGAGYYA